MISADQALAALERRLAAALADDDTCLSDRDINDLVNLRRLDAERREALRIERETDRRERERVARLHGRDRIAHALRQSSTPHGRN